MEVDAAYKLIEKAISEGRQAHGYLIVGSLRGAADELSRRVLHLLFGEKTDLLAHPDIHWLSPEKKSRIISVDAMREKLIAPMASTSFQGGWKSGVIVGTDRLKQESANAFLKTLEEPPPKTIFLLLTDSPEQLLPTIVSRCQRIDLDDLRGRGLRGESEMKVLRALLAMKPTTLSRAATVGRLVEVLEALKQEAQNIVDEREAAAAGGAGAEMSDDEYQALVSATYRAFRADFTLTIMNWFRDMMALVADGEAPLVNERYRAELRERASGMSYTSAFRNVEAVESFAASLELNVPELSLLSFLFDRIALK